MIHELAQVVAHHRGHDARVRVGLAGEVRLLRARPELRTARRSEDQRIGHAIQAQAALHRGLEVSDEQGLGDGALSSWLSCGDLNGWACVRRFLGRMAVRVIVMGVVVVVIVVMVVVTLVIVCVVVSVCLLLLLSGSAWCRWLFEGK